MATSDSLPSTPYDIHFAGLQDDVLFTLDTHPLSDILATGDVNGKISLYSYSSGEECKVLRSFNLHPGNSCRILKFSKNGNRLVSGSKDGAALYSTDVETGKPLRHVKKAHSAPLYAMHTVSENTLASGDEEGGIKLWDTRSWREVLFVKENKDYISNMASDEEKRTLLATSGDGSLSVLDLRRRRFGERSDCTESELLSLAVVKGGKKVVCGDGEGVLMIYHWGLWGDITDRYPSHPLSIDSMVQISSSVICTGCMDGVIRSVQILPNQILGTVGRHTAGFPIDFMCLTHDKAFLVSGSQDCCKFWPVEGIPKLKGSGSGDQEESWSKRRKRKRKQKTEGEREEEEGAGQNDFFADL